MSVITNKMNEKITGQRVAFAGCMASGKSYAAKFLQENWEEKTHILSLSSGNLTQKCGLILFTFIATDSPFNSLPNRYKLDPPIG